MSARSSTSSISLSKFKTAQSSISTSPNTDNAADQTQREADGHATPSGLEADVPHIQGDQSVVNASTACPSEAEGSVSSGHLSVCSQDTPYSRSEGMTYASQQAARTLQEDPESSQLDQKQIDQRGRSPDYSDIKCHCDFRLIEDCSLFCFGTCRRTCCCC